MNTILSLTIPSSIFTYIFLDIERDSGSAFERKQQECTAQSDMHTTTTPHHCHWSFGIIKCLNAWLFGFDAPWYTAHAHPRLWIRRAFHTDIIQYPRITTYRTYTYTPLHETTYFLAAFRDSSRLVLWSAYLYLDILLRDSHLAVLVPTHTPLPRRSVLGSYDL